MTNQPAYAASAGQTSARSLPARAAQTQAHREPPGARGSRPRNPPDRPRAQRDRLLSRWRRAGEETMTAVLRDGSVVLIRQIQATDMPLLSSVFARLSPTSRWMRFLAAKNHLTEAELRYLTDLDHHDHEALTALGPGGQGLGVARYIRHPADPEIAEIAIAIVDDWHGRGLGTQLLTLLADRARRAGIRRFTALISPDNEAMAGLLRTMHGEVTCREVSTVEYQIALPPDEHSRQPVPRAGQQRPARGAQPQRERDTAR